LPLKIFFAIKLSHSETEKEMFPHEAQAFMAKVMFFIFATALLCLSKANALEVLELLN
jgi:hypothetical protein